ncbi:MAG TPA: hypothetical protein VLH86_03455 [Patescibacteria group bacterium]|nr:hypothetical protein [Patescibacteria group bacterium]
MPESNGLGTTPCMVVEGNGANIGEVGQAVQTDLLSLPIESVPVVIHNINSAIDRLMAERCLPGANRELIDFKINQLMIARTATDEAGGGMYEAQTHYESWLGSAMLAETAGVY